MRGRSCGDRVAFFGNGGGQCLAGLGALDLDAVLCAGDLIESGEIRPSDVRTLTDILSGLKAAMYVVAGNHDPLDALSPYGRLTSGGLTVLPAEYSRTMLDADTAQAIARAESTRQAHATLFACPAFQWRA